MKPTILRVRTAIATVCTVPIVAFFGLIISLHFSTASIAQVIPECPEGKTEGTLVLPSGREKNDLFARQGGGGD